MRTLQPLDWDIHRLWTRDHSIRTVASESRTDSNHKTKWCNERLAPFDNHTNRSHRHILYRKFVRLPRVSSELKLQQHSDFDARWRPENAWIISVSGWSWLLASTNSMKLPQEWLPSSFRCLSSKSSTIALLSLNLASASALF